MLGDVLEVLAYREVLWTYALALAAADAVAGLAEVLGEIIVILPVRAPALLCGLLLVGIVEREVFGDRDIHRTSVGAVGAAGAGDGYSTVYDVNGGLDDGALLVVERLEVLHIRGVVEHLLHIAHAAEHHEHLRTARRKADRPGRI